MMTVSTRISEFQGRHDRFDHVIEGLLIAMLLLMPVMFGVVDAWSEEVVIALTAAMCMCYLLKLIAVGRCALTWTWAYVPIALFILVAVVQLIPMPSAWLQALSPNTVQQKTALLADLPPAERSLETMTVSFYRQATRHDLRLALAAAVVFAIVLNVYRRASQITRLLGAIAIIGGGVAFLCMLQNVIGNDKIYWCVPSPHGTAHSGPFVNHGHYAQFANLSIGAALGWILVKLYRKFDGRRVNPEAVSEFLCSREARLLWGGLGMVVLSAATIFLSLSRGGIISMIVAGAFTTLLLSARTSLRGSGWILVVVTLAAFVCLLYVGFDGVYDRLGTFGDLHQAQGGRWQVLKDVAVAWTRFPLLGTGLGTHEVVYPMFDRSTVAALASHAENEYAQAAEETGIVGLMALIGLATIIWRSYLRTLRSGRAPIHGAAYGLGFGLAAVMIHSLSDFGQHLPANAFLSVVFCALLIRLQHLPANDGGPSGEIVLEGRVARRWGLVGLLVASIVWGWALLDADAARHSAGHWKQALAIEADLAQNDWQARPEDYVRLITHTQAAAETEPGNITYRYWLAVYRWEAIRGTGGSSLSEVLQSSEGRQFVTRIVAELNEARACCPTFGPVWSVLGQLERFALDREEGEAHIRMGYKLAPCSPTACLVAAKLDIEQGHVELALAKLHRAVRLDIDCYAEVARVLVDELKRPDVALEMAGEHSSLTSQLARMLDDDAELAEAVDRKLIDLVERRCAQAESSADWHAMLAEMQRRRHDPEAAIESYREALTRDYGQVLWRLRRAQLLAERGQAVEARHEAQICLRLSPGMSAARRLLDRLSAPRVSLDEEG